VLVCVLRRSLPPDVDARRLHGRYLFVDADLAAPRTDELVVSLPNSRSGRNHLHSRRVILKQKRLAAACRNLPRFDRLRLARRIFGHGQLPDPLEEVRDSFAPNA
jgi:hypothetical protein